MKSIFLISVVFFASITLSAQEAPKEFMLNFTNVKVFSEGVVPALSVKVKPKSLDRFDFMLAYVSNFFTKTILQTPQKIENPKIQNMYIAMNYRF